MWFTPLRTREVISGVVTPNSFHCSWIKKYPHKKQLVLAAHTSYPLDSGTVMVSGLFNSTLIAQHLQSFLSQNALKNARIAIGLSPPLVRQRIVIGMLPDLGAYHEPDALPHEWLWQHHYLHPDAQAGSVFYVCGLPRTTHLQWNLLASRIPCELTTLTSDTMAMLCLYRTLYGSAFRESQLATHLHKTHHSIAHLFSRDALARILHIPYTFSFDRTQEHPILLTACGLYAAERNII